MEENIKTLKYPCDCVSSNPACEEPWARVAKEGMFKDGSKELVLNILHKEPKTIKQLADVMDLSQPTVHRHISELLNSGLIKEVESGDKEYVMERYYSPNFPVITAHDREIYKGLLNETAGGLADMLSQKMQDLEQLYSQTDASKSGWIYQEFSQFLYHMIQRKTRTLLSERGLLSNTLNKNGLDFIFWAEETKNGIDKNLENQF